MRKITRLAANAFMQRKPFKQSNAGYSTNTTKERLNGIPTVTVKQKNFEWYLNGEKWDGSLVQV